VDIHFACEQCGQRLTVEEEAAGQEIDCPSCNTKLLVPGVASRVAPELAHFFDILRNYHESSLEISGSNLGLDSVLIQATNVKLRNALSDLLQSSSDIMGFLKAKSMDVRLTTESPPQVEVNLHFEREE
jgi:DNA-directed RNA polymerase subunit RPC12/RpoP